MRSPESRLFLVRLAPVLTGTLILAGCYDLTRFKQERYECGQNANGLVEIDLRDFDKGSEATVTFTDETRTMKIVESTDDRFTLTDESLIIRVDRDTGTVRLTRGSRYRNVKCTKSEFHM